MSAATFPRALQLVLAHEGGYSNNPKDPGGATMKGVTQAVYNSYRKSKNLPTRSVRDISDNEIHDIYKSEYWDKVDGDKLPAGVDYCVFDYAVNSGVGKAVKDLQRELGVKVDGVSGNDTQNAAYAANPLDLITSLCNRRMAFLKSLKTWSEFGVGWKRRVMGEIDGSQATDNGVIDYAINLIPTTDPVPALPLPEAIGTKPGEVVPAKASGANQSVIKTVQGVGASLAAAGVTGQTAITVANEVKTKADGSIIGQIALILFVLLMIAGVGLVLVKYFRDRAEKSA